MRVIFYILIFYLLYKGLLYLLKYLAGQKKNTIPGNDIRMSNNKPKNNPPKRDIEEADYREIKDDDDKS